MSNKNIILKAENISKQYRLGTVGTGTLSHDLNRWWHTIRGKEDPYLKVGEVNDRTSKASSEYVWALQDINFEVEQGEVLGIIGKNGAGKSTLLKILSKVTAPTTGTIKSRGRIASLLEVGTGFNPELTGRENIYLNGAILGMTKNEITSKLDEIIEFSGCERYIDTPTKRYSSGMTVRLAFAVAAFLEPEILVVDEVLAVGDAEFQKKAIGKMQDISREGGRTVLFVSHNMAAVEELCSKALVISKGKIEFNGLVSDAINFYRENNANKISTFNQSLVVKSFKSKIISASILNFENEIVSSIKFGSSFKIKITIESKINLINPILSVRISNSSNTNIVTFRSNDYLISPILELNKEGTYEIILDIENLYLLNDVYEISIGFADGKEVLDIHQNLIGFEVVSAKIKNELIVITKENSSKSILFHEANWKIIS